MNACGSTVSLYEVISMSAFAPFSASPEKAASSPVSVTQAVKPRGVGSASVLRLLTFRHVLCCPAILRLLCVTLAPGATEAAVSIATASGAEMKPAPVTVGTIPALVMSSWPVGLDDFWQVLSLPHSSSDCGVTTNRPSGPMNAALGGCCATVVEPPATRYSAVKVNWSLPPSFWARSPTDATLFAACLTWPSTPQPSIVAAAATATNAKFRGVMPTNVRAPRCPYNELSGLRHRLVLRPMEVTIRRACPADVRDIQRLIELYADDRILLRKAPVALYEDVQEFWVAERTDDGAVVGCGALHVMWEDLAEVRTVAVDTACRGHKIGHRIVSELLAVARELGVARVFVLTFQTSFFASFGFRQIDGTPVSPAVYEELLRSYDEGVAEFLDLERVKPNTLGNTRMLLHLR